MAATGYSIADPSEDGVLGVARLDAARPKLISGLIRLDRLAPPRRFGDAGEGILGKSHEATSGAS